LPVAGDKLVCLRNNRKKGLFNGGLWRVKSPRAVEIQDSFTMRLSPDEDFGHKVTKVSVRGDCFGGAIETVPGNSASPMTNSITAMCSPCTNRRLAMDDVVLFDESFAFQDSRARWLYTGITRAAKRLSWWL